MKIYEILLGIIMLGMTQLSQIPVDIGINDVVMESGRNEHEKYNDYYESVIGYMGWI